MFHGKHLCPLPCRMLLLRGDSIHFIFLNAVVYGQCKIMQILSESTWELVLTQAGPSCGMVRMLRQ